MNRHDDDSPRSEDDLSESERIQLILKLSHLSTQASEVEHKLNRIDEKTTRVERKMHGPDRVTGKVGNDNPVDVPENRPRHSNNQRDPLLDHQCARTEQYQTSDRNNLERGKRASSIACSSEVYQGGRHHQDQDIRMKEKVGDKNERKPSNSDYHLTKKHRTESNSSNQNSQPKLDRNILTKVRRGRRDKQRRTQVFMADITDSDKDTDETIHSDRQKVSNSDYPRLVKGRRDTDRFNQSGQSELDYSIMGTVRLRRANKYQPYLPDMSKCDLKLATKVRRQHMYTDESQRSDSHYHLSDKVRSKRINLQQYREKRTQKEDSQQRQRPELKYRSIDRVPQRLATCADKTPGLSHGSCKRMDKERSDIKHAGGLRRRDVTNDTNDFTNEEGCEMVDIEQCRLTNQVLIEVMHKKMRETEHQHTCEGHRGTVDSDLFERYKVKRMDDFRQVAFAPGQKSRSDMAFTLPYKMKREWDQIKVPVSGLLSRHHMDEMQRGRRSNAQREQIELEKEIFEAVLRLGVDLDHPHPSVAEPSESRTDASALSDSARQSSEVSHNGSNANTTQDNTTARDNSINGKTTLDEGSTRRDSTILDDSTRDWTTVPDTSTRRDSTITDDCPDTHDKKHSTRDRATSLYKLETESITPESPATAAEQLVEEEKPPAIDATEQARLRRRHRIELMAPWMDNCFNVAAEDLGLPPEIIPRGAAFRIVLPQMSGVLVERLHRRICPRNSLPVEFTLPLRHEAIFKIFEINVTEMEEDAIRKEVRRRLRGGKTENFTSRK